MNQFKRAQIILLHTILDSIDRKSQILWLNTKNQLLHTHSSSSDLIPCNLYIISSGNKEQDDKIKEGDYIYDSYKNSVYQATKVVIHNMKSLDYEQYLRKIIATTDTSLFKLEECLVRGSDSSVKYILPQPSQQFIKKYIESYNKGEIITDVLVEYDYCSNRRTKGDLSKCTKINPKDNTITIKKLKNNWNRKEVEENL